MTESQYVPRRIADLALTIPEDTARLADLVEGERAAAARVVEAERVLSVARAEAAQAERERRELEGDIKAVHALLEYGRERYGYNVAPLLTAPPVPGLPFTPQLTPSQGVPVVTRATVVPGDPYCCVCGASTVRVDGVLLHERSQREECHPEEADRANGQPADAARSEQDGGEDR